MLPAWRWMGRVLEGNPQRPGSRAGSSHRSATCLCPGSRPPRPGAGSGYPALPDGEGSPALPGPRSRHQALRSARARLGGEAGSELCRARSRGKSLPKIRGVPTRARKRDGKGPAGRAFQASPTARLRGETSSSKFAEWCFRKHYTVLSRRDSIVSDNVTEPSIRRKSPATQHSCDGLTTKTRALTKEAPIGENANGD